MRLRLRRQDARKRSRRSPVAGRARCARALSFSPALQMPAIFRSLSSVRRAAKKVSCSSVVSREGDCSGLFSHQVWRRGGELFSVSVVHATAFKGSVSGAQVRWFLPEHRKGAVMSASRKKRPAPEPPPTSKQSSFAAIFRERNGQNPGRDSRISDQRIPDQFDLDHKATKMKGGGTRQRSSSSKGRGSRKMKTAPQPVDHATSYLGWAQLF